VNETLIALNVRVDRKYSSFSFLLKN